MPELPEVETIRRQLEPRLRGRLVVDATSHPSPKFSAAPAAVGTTIRSVGRRGKYLVIGLDPATRTAGDAPGAGALDLIVHLGMTGSLRVRPDDGRDPDPYVRASWVLDRPGERFELRDVRRFGRIAVVPTGDHRSLPTLAALGPEPFDEEFTPEHLWVALRASDRHVKTQLLSQRPVAGVGNIYADEALWLARINPARRSVTRAEAVVLRDAVRTVLADGLRHGGTTLRDYVDGEGRAGDNQHHLRCYGRAGEPCERCGNPLSRRVIDARTTTWCRTCQPAR